MFTESKLCLLIVILLGFSSQTHAVEGNASRVLNQIEKRIQGVQKPIFIFDLDETIVDSMVRRYLSYQDAINEECPDRDDPIWEKSCRSASLVTVSDFLSLPNRYNDRDLFLGRGVVSSVFDVLFKRALEIYLSDRWIAESDSFIPGGGRFMKKIEQLGGEIFYASSRSHSNQLKGTLDSLYRLGLLAPGEEWRVRLKPEGEKSLDFKLRLFTEIAQYAARTGGEVVGVFENEPENMNAMIELFPNAVSVFVKGAYLKHEPVHPQAIQIRDFWF